LDFSPAVKAKEQKIKYNFAELGKEFK